MKAILSKTAPPPVSVTGVTPVDEEDGADATAPLLPLNRLVVSEKSGAPLVEDDEEAKQRAAAAVRESEYAEVRAMRADGRTEREIIVIIIMVMAGCLLAGHGDPGKAKRRSSNE